MKEQRINQPKNEEELIQKFKKMFDTAINVVFAIILVFITLGIALGAVQLFASVWALVKMEGITGQYIGLITDVLTLYVLVELSRSLVDYFSSQKLRLTFIVDAAIIFVIRELLIGLFKHEIKPDMLYALCAFLFVLGALRTAAIIVYQREKQISSDKNV